jgi:hypothetical protein
MPTGLAQSYESAKRDHAVSRARAMQNTRTLVMGRRRYITNPVTRTWTLLRFDLSDDEAGFLLERGGICGDGQVVHAFRTREAALEYVRRQDPSIESIPNGGFYDLRAVEAFVDRRATSLPPASLDVWSLLGEVAKSVGRDIPALAHATLPTVTGTGSSLVNPLRVALAAGLDAFRDLVSYHDPAQPLLHARARRATTPASHT